MMWALRRTERNVSDPLQSGLMMGEVMTLDHLTTLTNSGESETLEFKETTDTRRQATMTACSFPNQGGRQVLFGVSPTEAIVGQQVSKRGIEELSAEPRRVDPQAFPAVERVPLDGGNEVIVVRTDQGNEATNSRLIPPRSLTYVLLGNNSGAQ